MKIDLIHHPEVLVERDAEEKLDPLTSEDVRCWQRVAATYDRFPVSEIT